MNDPIVDSADRYNDEQMAVAEDEARFYRDCKTEITMVVCELIRETGSPKTGKAVCNMIDEASTIVSEIHFRGEPL